MGGLQEPMPFTHATFLIGTLALIGIPPLSGFWSKDADPRLGAGATGGVLGWTLYVAGLVGALLTGIYAFRLYFYVFRGEPRGERRRAARGRARGGHGEGPRSMLIPVARPRGALGVGGLLAGPRRLGALRRLDRPGRRAARRSRPSRRTT